MYEGDRRKILVLKLNIYFGPTFYNALLLSFQRGGGGYNTSFKGIVSRDFEVCFLIPLDSSGIATLFFIIRALVVVVFPVSESRLRE
jgi:hypothetical protein